MRQSGSLRRRRYDRRKDFWLRGLVLGSVQNRGHADWVEARLIAAIGASDDYRPENEVQPEPAQLGDVDLANARKFLRQAGELLLLRASCGTWRTSDRSCPTVANRLAASAKGSQPASRRKCR